MLTHDPSSLEAMFVVESQAQVLSRQTNLCVAADTMVSLRIHFVAD